MTTSSVTPICWQRVMNSPWYGRNRPCIAISSPDGNTKTTSPTSASRGTMLPNFSFSQAGRARIAWIGGSGLSVLRLVRYISSRRNSNGNSSAVSRCLRSTRSNSSIRARSIPAPRDNWSSRRNRLTCRSNSNRLPSATRAVSLTTCAGPKDRSFRHLAVPYWLPARPLRRSLDGPEQDAGRAACHFRA